MRRLPLFCALLLAALSVPALAAHPVAPGYAVRDPALAGAWYPGDPAQLRAEMERRAGQPGHPPGGTPLALIAPHAGFAFSGEVASRTFAALGRAEIRRVFLLGPSHHMGFPGVALPAKGLGAYGTAFGPLPLDRTAVEALRGLPGFGGPPTALEPEHSVEMLSIFVAARYPGVKAVPLVVGDLGSDADVRRVAEGLRGVLGPGDLVAASSDFTHYGPRYGYAPFPIAEAEKGLARLADWAAKPLLAADLAGFTGHLTRTGDSICGREAVRLLLALLPPGAKGREAARDTSGRMTGDYSNSVTYLGIVYGTEGGWTMKTTGRAGGADKAARVLGPEEEKRALAIARRTLELYLASKKVPDDRDLGVPEDGPFRRDGAVFVTLLKNKRLRGCIGHILPCMPLWQSIRDNAIAAATCDARFPPVDRAELGGLELDVSVLTLPKPIPGPEGFVVGRHGILMELSGRRAVFLPQVAPEQGWDRETTLMFLSQKAGLPPDAWRDPRAQFQVFEAQVVGEKE